jgi:hypothetical protein
MQRVPVCGELRLEDMVNETAITVGSSEETEVWIVPVETVSHADDGMETCYQSTSIVLRYPVTIGSGSAGFSTSISVRFDRL